MARDLEQYINLKLVALGEVGLEAPSDRDFMQLAGPLLRNFHQKDQLLKNRLCPVDARIQEFLNAYLLDCGAGATPRLPARTLVMDRAGMARVLSFPPSAQSFQSKYLTSYRVPQGVLHNPASDRRTTKGVFHIVDGGLPVPADKLEVPKRTFAALLRAALDPPKDLLALPYLSGPRLFASLLLRPLVMPESSWGPEKNMEIRFFAPGTLVSNLDFVETIFGNGGDPELPENDAALDALHWTGHTGCVILAPHLVDLTKKELGLPHVSEATDRQKRDRMCWSDEAERYNDGHAFKVACRDHRGVMVTLIADNYFGYCKKEVKTQISYAANLYGLCEEEHSGGAIAFPAYVMGQDFIAGQSVKLKPTTFAEALALLGEDRVDLQPDGYAIDRNHPNIYYLPEDAVFSVREGEISWNRDGARMRLVLRAGVTYILPSGYRLRLEKQLKGSAWRLLGTRADATLCHKPCTVSGGGKSEISKSLADVMLSGPVFVRDFYGDLKTVEEILKRDFSGIYRNRPPDARSKRPVLALERSLGSVIKLLTPSEDYTDEHNAWLRSLPQTIRQLVFMVKRYYRPSWGTKWQEHFTVDHINGYLGHELKYEGQKLVGNYLRVGYDPQGSWRIYKLRSDFYPADKVQVEDDITASMVLPRERLSHLDSAYTNASMKLVANCENMLFQRPDEAIHRGSDAQAEADIAGPNVFLSNFAPLTRAEAQAIVDHVVEFDRYTTPMKTLLSDFVAGDGEYVVSSAHPRMVDGQPSKNPRYLQQRPDRVRAGETYAAFISARLDRGVPNGEEVTFPVNAVLPGRRNNPPDKKLGIAPLAVYNPIHYQELPELFMEFISSLTGKSPSTTGFGSEGALTKGPFNALPPVIDLNNALVSMLLTETPAFTTSAGHIGPNYRVDHDISMLAPEIWCRMRVEERDPAFLIANGYLEKLDDFEWQGRTVLASRLGYRITARFTEYFLGRMFETPDAVFPEELLRPEKQSQETFVEGVDAIVDSQRRVALTYFDDGSVDAACPPLRLLLNVMAHGKGLQDPQLRSQFTRESLLKSDWYAERLRTKQRIDSQLWERHVLALDQFRRSGLDVPEGLDLAARANFARAQRKRVLSEDYLKELAGTIGADPAGQSRN